MKKFISMGLIAATVTSMAVSLAGCKSGENNNLVWYMLGDKPADHDAVMEKANEIIEPELGMKLDIEYIDGASYAEKMKMKMASGESYDLAFTGYVNGYQTAVSLGGLYDITDLIDNITMKNGDKVKISDVVEDYFLESAMVNGKIYGVPNTQVVSNPSCLFMLKSVADECGFDAEGLEKLAYEVKDLDSTKKYLDAVTDALAKIKEKRPDLYTIVPFTFPGNYAEVLSRVFYIDKSGESDEIKVLYDIPEYIYSVDTVRKWFEAGYIRNDIASIGTPSSVEDKKQYAVTVTSWKPGCDVFDAKDFGGDVVYSKREKPYVGRENPLLTMISVGRNTKHPEEAVKMIYMMNSNKELYNLICWGIEGKHYTKIGENTIKQIEDSGYTEVGSKACLFGNQFNSYLMEGQPENVWEETKKMNDEAEKFPGFGFIPDTDQYSAELANIANTVSEYKAKIEYGTSARDEYWDEFKKKLNDAGVEKVREALQEQYDEFLKNRNK